MSTSQARSDARAGIARAGRCRRCHKDRQVTYRPGHGPLCDRCSAKVGAAGDQEASQHDD